jgi:hypothetical protein
MLREIGEVSFGIPSRTWKPMLSQSRAVSQLWRGMTTEVMEGVIPMVLTGGGGKEVAMVAVSQLSDEKIQTKSIDAERRSWVW